jgi:hypothetical protein
MKKENHIIVFLFLLLFMAACNSGTRSGSQTPDADAGTDTSTDTGDTPDISDPWAAWYETDPQGRITENNQLDAPPEMLVVSDDELADAWASYARLRTLDGHPRRGRIRNSGQFAGRDAPKRCAIFFGTSIGAARCV